MGSNEILRIFLSSTAIDMVDHRQSVVNALLRTDNFPVRMESFGAQPNSPVSVCKQKVLESDALVVMIAHRYGWVPTAEEGGDGKKSITWIEVETALENNIPVYAFIVDPEQPWNQPKEQDILTTNTDETKIPEIIKNVKALVEFKKFLEAKAGITRDKFTTPDNLALNVSTSLKALNKVSNTVERQAVKRIPFVFRTVHYLQPAPHFRGRKKLLQELNNWWNQPVTPDRVCSLVAIGGTGKTAVVEQFLGNIDSSNLKGSVLVWSFYDEPNTDAFLREACIVFSGEEPDGAGGKLEKLQRALGKDGSQHLIILDGLERVQSEGKGNSGNAKGDLEDHRLKNLLRAIAAGLGNTRAIITSRFKLTDLSQWENRGYKSYELDVLDEETSIAILRAWGIKGEDSELAKVARSVGNHALSVSVLGSYLNHYYNCDLEGIKAFKLNEITADESQAARLARILGGYAKSLPNNERDFLIRLSVFPNGVSIDILGYLIDSGGEIAGTLVGISQQNLIIIAERLRNQGLIYSYKSEKSIIYTAHPFLRDYFRALLLINPEDLHEVVKNKLAMGLDTKPVTKPSDRRTLDKYEELIEHCVLAGDYQQAISLYSDVMGGGAGSSHLLHTVCDYGRIIRIAALFSEDGTPTTIREELRENWSSILLSIWGVSCENLGDVKTAELCFETALTISTEQNDILGIIPAIVNRSFVNITKGTYVIAENLLKQAERYILELNKYSDEIEYRNYLLAYYYSFYGYTLHKLGKIELAVEHFSIAEKIEEDGLYSLAGALKLQHLFDLGFKDQCEVLVEKQLLHNLQIPAPRDVNFCHYMNAIIDLPGSIVKARDFLGKIRQWSEQSGDIGTILNAHMLASEIAFHSKDYPAAIIELEAGLNLANGCGYGALSIDLLLQLSNIYLAVPDVQKALSYGRQALDRASDADCQNIWGEANASYLCGICHKELGEYTLARQRLSRALELRQKIQHPEIDEPRKLLQELPDK